MDCNKNEEKKCLFDKVIALLTGGTSNLEIVDVFCHLLDISVEDYVQHLHNFTIRNQWDELYAKNITETDICFALTRQTMDYESRFTNAIARIHGIQQKGDEFELKKDYFQIVEGQQVYQIPAGREINEVLWYTPSEIRRALVSSSGAAYYGNGTFGFGAGGGSNFGFAGGAYDMSRAAYYVAPLYDTVLRANDFGIKHRMLRGELLYKVTNGPNGTKLVHLYSTPNQGNNIGIRKELYNCKVWYHYYDTKDMDAEQKNKCLKECEDIIKYPSQIPLESLDYCDLNSTSKTWVRRLFTAYAKEALGRSRGKFKGEVKTPKVSVNIDWESFLSESKEEKKEIKEEIEKWLDDMKPEKVMERKANEQENLSKILSHTPTQIIIR